MSLNVLPDGLRLITIAKPGSPYRCRWL